MATIVTMRSEERHSPPAPPVEASFDSMAPLQHTVVVIPPKNKRERAVWNRAIEYDKLDAAGTQREFTRLNRELTKAGNAVSFSRKTAIPNLSNMQCLLSQRGKLRSKVVAGLPKWSDYLKKWADKYGVNERTLRRDIRRFRGKTPAPPKKTDDPFKPKVTPGQLRKLLKGAEKLGAIVEAHRNHREVDPLIDAAAHVIMSADEQLKILEGWEPDPLETVLVPVVAAALAYIKTMEDVIYYHAVDIAPERLERLEQNKAAWRSAGYVYEQAKKPVSCSLTGA